MATGLTIGAVSLRDDAAPAWVAVWALGLMISGAGVGIAWPHLSAWAMSKVDDPAEGPAAAAAINTVQVICGAFGAALAGVIVNVTNTGDSSAARWLFACFAILAALAAVASARSGRPAVTRSR